ncbi:hypothetical protein I8J31_05410 [Marinomonas sp. C1424]|uniref:Uncharacterized protein n=1 Tax=Marinomonas transparens TaxID=2795388 RepID=A0A934MZ34_9GAMM|nr:hypothetical protein [Marinomonas transparens]
MHTILVLVCGVILLGVFLSFGWLWHMTPFPSAKMLKLFIPVWFGISGWNLWIGVVTAGYSLYEEALVFPQVFLPPVCLALAIMYWL